MEEQDRQDLEFGVNTSEPQPTSLLAELFRTSPRKAL